MLKRLLFALIGGLMLPLAAYTSDCTLAPVPLASKVQASDLIVEAEVLSKRSFWDPAHTLIYTAYELKASRLYQGQLGNPRLILVGIGGTIGNQSLEVNPSFSAKVGEKGIFFLQNRNAHTPGSGQLLAPEYSLFAGPQGIIRFAQNRASSPFFHYGSVSQARTAVQTLTGLSQNLTTPGLGSGGPMLTPPPPTIISFSPTTLTAGTGSVLTINGNNFGATQGKVWFPNANTGGSTEIDALSSQILSWSNTQITVEVPTLAGTGNFRVETTGATQSFTSPSILTIDYAQLNVVSANQAYRHPHIDLNGNGGITWTYNTAFSGNAAATAAFERSLENWRCATFINWDVASNTTSIGAVGSDGVNLVSFDNAGGPPLPFGVLGANYTFRISCTVNGQQRWYVTELDHLYSASYNWQYGPALPAANEYDFESVSLHELGHGHQLGHVINTNAVMHFSIGAGVTRRTLLPNSEVAGGLFVMTQSTNPQGCGGNPIQPLNAANCALNAPVADFSASPRQVCPGFNVQFTDLSTGSPTAWQWTFPGGTPGTSNLQNPLITYNTAGTYDVQLVVTNAAGQDTLRRSNFITVSVPTANFSGSTTIFAGQNAFLQVDLTGTPPWSITYTDGVTPVTINGITNSPHFIAVSPTATTSYNLTAVSDANCNGTFSGSPVITVQPLPPLNPGLGAPFWVFSTPTGQQPVTYDWNNGGRIDSINVPTQTAGKLTGTAFNECGEPMFHVVHTQTLAPNNLLPTDLTGAPLAVTGMNGTISEDFLHVIRVPKRHNEWYIIYTEFTTQVLVANNVGYTPANLAWSRIRYDVDCNVFQYMVKDSVLRANGVAFTYFQGKAVSATAGNNPDAHYLYASRRAWNSSILSLDRFLIDENGIRWDANTGDISVPFWNLGIAGSDLEVSPNGRSVAQCVRNQTSNITDFIIWDAVQFSNTPGAYQEISCGDLILQPDGVNVLTAQPVTTAAASSASLGYLNNFERKLQMGDYSPSGRYLYIMSGGYAGGSLTNVTYLAQIDLQSTYPYEVRIQSQQPPNGVYSNVSGAGCNFSGNPACLDDYHSIADVQQAPDGRLYFTKRGMDSLFVIPTPDAPMAQRIIPGWVDLSNAGNPNIPINKEISRFPEQIDGYPYARPGANLLDLVLSIEGCQGCIASDSTPQLVELYSSGGVLIECMPVMACPDTFSMCLSSDSVYTLRYQNLSYDSAIVNATANNPYNFILNFPVQATMDTLGPQCDSLTSVQLTGYPAGGVFSGPGVTNPTAGIFDPSSLGPGNYRLFYEYTDSITGCSGRDSVEVNINPCCSQIAATPQVTQTPVSCAGDSNGVIFANASGPTPPYRYSLDGINFFNAPATFTNLGAGTYNLTLVDSLGCDTAFTFQVTEPTALAPTLASVVNVSCNGSNDGEITLNVSGGIGPYEYSLDGINFSSNATISGLSAGNYSLIIRDANGCMDTLTSNISEPSLLVLNGVVDSVSCANGQDGLVTLSASGGTPGYQFSSDGIIFGGNNQFNNLAAGVYTFYVRDANNCLDSISVQIFEPQPLILNTFFTGTTCGNVNPTGTATVVANGGTGSYTYLWSNNGTTSTITGLASGTYTVTVTDAKGCQENASVTIPSTSAPTVQAGPDVSFCEGEGGTLLSAFPSGGTPGYYFQWWCDSTNTFCGLDSIFDDDPLANPTVSTWYYVQVTDTNGCQSNIDSLFVTVHPKPIVDAGADLWLCGDSAPCQILNPSISGGSGLYSYQWIPSQGLSNPNILNPCARPDTTTIYALIATDLTTGCSSDFNTTDTLSTVVVHVNPIPLAEAGPDRDLCFGDTVMLQGSGSGAGPLYTYQWSPSLSLSDSTQPNPLAFPSLSTWYSLVVWSNNCPSYADSVLVDVHALPTVNAGPDRDICLGESLQLHATASGDSTTTFSFSWSPASTLDNPLSSDPVATPDSLTTYTVIATSGYGCESVPDSLTLTLKPTPLAEAGPEREICQGDTVQLLGSYYYGNTPPVPDPNQIWYTWNPAVSLSDSTLAQPQAWPAGSQWYYLQVQHNTCFSLDSVLVTVLPSPKIDLGADTTITCQGDSVQLSASGGLGNASFTWSPANGLSNPNIPDPKAAPEVSTTYFLTLSEGSCASEDSIRIEIIPTPVAAAVSSLNEGCVPHTVNFLQTASDAIFYVWDFGDGSPVSNQPNPVHTYTQAGTYTVTLTAVNQGGCTHSNEVVTVSVGDSLRVDFTSDPDAPVELTLPATGVQFLDRSGPARQWTWDFGDGAQSNEQNPQHRFSSEGTYFVTLSLTDEYGCVSKLVKGPYLVLPPELDIPNVFSPNDDGINDRFWVTYTGNQPFLLQIYDRWGVQLYEGRDKYEGWRGLNQNGEDVPAGVYFYILKVGEREFAGEVSLVR